MATKSWGAKGVWIWEIKEGLLERWYKSWNCPEGQNLDRWLWEEQFLVQVEEAAAWIWGPMSCLVCLENKIQCSVAFLVDEITRDSGWFPACTWTHAPQISRPCAALAFNLHEHIRGHATEPHTTAHPYTQSSAFTAPNICPHPSAHLPDSILNWRQE